MNIALDPPPPCKNKIQGADQFSQPTMVQETVKSSFKLASKHFLQRFVTSNYFCGYYFILWIRGQERQDQQYIFQHLGHAKHFFVYKQLVHWATTVCPILIYQKIMQILFQQFDMVFVFVQYYEVQLISHTLKSNCYGIFQMLQIIATFSIIITLFQISLQLVCPSFEDYSQSLVQCVQQCPSNTVQHLNKCLTSQQYLIADQVHKCNGPVNDDRSLCCLKSQYIFNGQCFKCSGILIGNLCCPSGTYVDISGNQTKCVKLTTGPCPSLKINSPIKYCCGNGAYNIRTKSCSPTAGLTCDSGLKYCCPFGESIQFHDNQPICTPLCSWATGSQLFCQSQLCSEQETVTNVSPIPIGNNANQLVSLNGQCCYGIRNSECVKDSVICGNRVLNRGWSICCAQGTHYNLVTKVCQNNCQGIILFETICVPLESALDFRGVQPTSMPISTPCNGKQLPTALPVCCPKNFYLNYTDGCKLCPSGRIFKVTTSQVCCKQDQFFDKDTQTCQFCQGKTDQKGMLCCKKGQYVQYNKNGIPSCISTCPNDNLFQSKYCCRSLTDTQCQKTGFKESICSQTYFFQQSSCQVCPRLCSAPQFCVQNSSSIENCSPYCFPGEVLSSDSCFTCSQSCITCSAAFSASSCIQCAQGYTKVSDTCLTCSIQCATCSSSASTCTSCDQYSSAPVLFGSTCVLACTPGSFYTASTNVCTQCSAQCLTCSGLTNSQCTKCQPGKFIPTSSSQAGMCATCSNECLQCQNTRKCLVCKNSTLKLDTENGVCSSQCVITKLEVYYEPLKHNICVDCHQSCNGCSQIPQNCKNCKNSRFYKNSSLGMNLCVPCIQPCLLCESHNKCTTCDTLSGYFLDLSASSQLNCKRCHSHCKTCSGSSQSNCLSCHGDAILSSRTCNGCSSSCEICSQSNTRICVKCVLNRLVFQNSCVTTCPSRSFRQNSSSACLACLPQCETCQNRVRCLTCRERYPFMENFKCVSACSPLFQPFGRQCIPRDQTFVPIPAPIPTPTPTPNNTNNNTTNKTEEAKVVDQSFIITDANTAIANLYANNQNLNQKDVQFFLINRKTGNFLELQQKSFIKQGNKSTFQLKLPNMSFDNYEASETRVKSLNPQKIVSTKLTSQLITYQLQRDPLAGLKWIGLTLFIASVSFGILTKGKDHFSGQSANTIILHLFNFVQVTYFFKFSQLQTQALYNFLEGFGFANLNFLPSFFNGAIPKDYVEYPAERSLTPDGNLIRNAGFSLSFIIIVIGLIVLAFIVSYAIHKIRQLDQPPMLRKIGRIGFFLIHIGFLNILFFSFAQLIQPSFVQPQYQSFYRSSFIASIAMVIAIPAVMIAFVIHYYFTYYGDVLEHYYSLREASHFLLLYLQSIVLVFSIGKPLIGLALIPLEISWLLFNYALYYYGNDESILNQIKLFICSGAIIVAYIFLSLMGTLNWIAIMVVVGIMVLVLLVYAFWQVFTLYFFNLVRAKDKITEKILD